MRLSSICPQRSSLCCQPWSWLPLFHFSCLPSPTGAYGHCFSNNPLIFKSLSHKTVGQCLVHFWVLVLHSWGMNKCLLMEVWVSVPSSETLAVSQFCFPQDCSLCQPDFSYISSWSASHLLFYLFQKLHYQFFKNVLLCLGFMFAPHLDFYICVIPSNGQSSNPSPVINWCLLGGWEVWHLLSSVLNSQIYKLFGHVLHPLF